MTGLSEKHIVIDFGNTFKKIAVFQGESLISIKLFKEAGFRNVEKYLKSLPQGHPCIISSVIDYPSSLEATLKSHFSTLFLSTNTTLPIKNRYTTPQTLGKDRIAAAVAGWNLFPGQNILIINAGTAITIDFLNQKSEYLGGSISPGIALRFKALHLHTGHLPLIRGREINFLTGRTTQESILSGVINGTASEIDGMIDRYRQNHPELKTILGGGDAIFLHKRLKNSIFALPNLTLIGLNDILNYNIENSNIF